MSQNQETTKKQFETPDLYFAAALKAWKVIFLGIHREYDDRGRSYAIFTFQDDGQILDLKTDYYNNRPIPVADYKAAILDLKELIFANLGPGGRR
jgi:hypothetical protein